MVAYVEKFGGMRYHSTITSPLAETPEDGFLGICLSEILHEA